MSPRVPFVYRLALLCKTEKTKPSHWLSAQEKAFQHIKALLVWALFRGFSLQAKKLWLRLASKDGLGACLFQEGNPVAYALSSLTASEQNYVQIQKALMAIVFACEKCHQYVYGQPVKMVKDHQLLESLTKKYLNEVSQRPQQTLLNFRDFPSKFHTVLAPKSQFQMPYLELNCNMSQSMKTSSLI